MRVVKLIKADVRANNNKYWQATLNDDGSISAEYGRVGKTPQVTHYPASRGGEGFFNRKVREKEKKGYKEARVVGSSENDAAPVNKGDLEQIAMSQIETSGDPLVDRLVKRLVKENIHNIEGATSITFNASTGLFQTPLGVVTLDALEEARKILSKIKPLVVKEDWRNNQLLDLCQDYLMIVPSDIGMKKFDPSDFFYDGQDSVTKQLDILDALKSSYEAMQKKPKGTKKQKDAPKVFDLSLSVVGPAELKSIQALYRKTSQSIHMSSEFKVKAAYDVTMHFSRDRFNKDGLGNVWELWHGTNTANLLSILKSGLKIAPPSTASIAGKAFGNGVYFSDQSTKSLNYAAGYWTGGRYSNCFMFLANVAMGNYYCPKNTTSRPPGKGYDSYFAKAGQPFRNNEMIVFNEHQFDLVKLVEFEK